MQDVVQPGSSLTFEAHATDNPDSITKKSA
jgi:hypothetical protein